MQRVCSYRQHEKSCCQDEILLGKQLCARQTQVLTIPGQNSKSLKFFHGNINLSGLERKIMRLFSKCLDQEAVLSFVNILTLFDHSEHCFKHLNKRRKWLRIVKPEFLTIYLKLNHIRILLLCCLPVLGFYWRILKHINTRSSQSKKLWFP